MSRIQFDNVSYSHTVSGRNVQVLKDISFSVNEGEFVSIVGPRGSGESALLKLVEGRIAPTSGAISIVDAGLVQGLDAVGGLRISHNAKWSTMEFGFLQLGASREIGRGGNAAPKGMFLRRIPNAEYLEEHEKAGSGSCAAANGSQARALVSDSDIILLDDPFAKADSASRATLQDMLLKVSEGEAGSPRKTVIHATQDVDEAITLSDRIILMKGHPGQIIAELQVPFQRPRNRSEIIAGKRYTRIRNQIMTLLFGDIKNRISEHNSF